MPVTDSDSNRREQGIDFGELDERVDEGEFPMTTDELIENYGEVELGLPDGTKTVEEVLGSSDVESQEFESMQEIREAVLGMVDDDALGREGYSDRGGQAPDEEQESF